MATFVTEVLFFKWLMWENEGGKKNKYKAQELQAASETSLMRDTSKTSRGQRAMVDPCPRWWMNQTPHSPLQVSNKDLSVLISAMGSPALPRARICVILRTAWGRSHRSGLINRMWCSCSAGGTAKRNAGKAHMRSKNPTAPHPSLYHPCTFSNPGFKLLLAWFYLNCTNVFRSSV